jgi:quercetin dioxygenase-like cupin family protein
VSWDWPEELDALAAASEHHSRLLENERVRVIETHIPPGETTPVHTHRWPNVQYLVSSTDFIRRDGQGDVVLDTRASARKAKAHSTLWSEPLPPHSIENVGENDLRVIMVELKG